MNPKVRSNGCRKQCVQTTRFQLWRRRNSREELNLVLLQTPAVAGDKSPGLTCPCTKGRRGPTLGSVLIDGVEALQYTSFLKIYSSIVFLFVMNILQTLLAAFLIEIWPLLHAFGGR